MTVEELQSKYEELYGKPAAGPHKNKASWLEKKIEEFGQEEKKDKIVSMDETKQAKEAKMGFTIDRNVKCSGKYYSAGDFIEEGSREAEVLIKFKQ